MFSAIFSPKTRFAKSVISAFLFIPLFVIAAEQPQKPQAMPVVAKAVIQQDVATYAEYSARSQSAQQVDVYARVSGILEKKFFTEGQTVKTGQLLYKIDDRKYRAMVLKAKAQVSVAQANLNQAEREYNRVKGLYKNKAVSAQEVDSALSTLELAKANLLGQQAALNETQIDLDYTEVRAEASGVIGIKQQDIGSLVGSSSDNSLLTTITQLDTIHVIFAIPDADFTKQQKMVEAGKLKALPQKEWTAEIINNQNKVLASGHINFIDSQINPATGSIQARAVFDNPNTNLLPGEFVRLRVGSAIRRNVFVIPQKAVLQMGQQAFVYKVEDGIANLAPVQIEAQQGNNWLIDSGLKDGDMVVVNNLIKLRPKTPVTVLPEKTANADNNQSSQ
ncbi:efflux RND transporter periplasmic adaptor subunit [Thiomicrorhabdus sp. Kp2]|uniref:efflux RND transporter periplasmic adaptor subunit n=1 Tax=Thiomicrorhabdus sp. Kp2 TaxID=1123518 RepID=UPI000426CC0E|nr:efflux RND transporter periplasmic adaptor subunit [Thiomicrorhabdus sp. Kp2]